MKGKLIIGEKIKTKNITLSEEEFEDQNPYIEEEQTTQWLKEKVQKNKTYIKTNDRVTRTPLKTEGELRCSGSISSSTTPVVLI